MSTNTYSIKELNCSKDSTFDFNQILLKYNNQAYKIASMLFNSSLQPMLEDADINDNYSHATLYYQYNNNQITIIIDELFTIISLTVSVYNQDNRLIRYNTRLNASNIEHLDLIAKYILKIENAYEYTERQVEDILTTMCHKTYEDTILNEH